MISPTRTAKEVILRHVIILCKKHLVIFENKSKLLNMVLNILNYYEAIYNNIKYKQVGDWLWQVSTTYRFFNTRIVIN